MTEPFSRRTLLIIGVSAAATAATAACAQNPRPPSELAVYKSPTCGCCRAWAEHMTGAGFKVRTTEVDDPGAVRRVRGVPDSLAACHTAVIGGYVLEGHVPAEDVRRLLVERPDALGLAVPAMPLGAPGMEMPDGRREPYETLLILKGGGARVFARHV